MGYIENNLLQDEKIIYQTKVHYIIFSGPILLLILSFIILLFRDIATGYLAHVIFFLGLTSLFFALIIYLTSEFTITNKRVVIKYGFLKRVTFEMNLEKIEEIQIEQTILGRILNFGTIIIRGTGGTYQVFKGISEPIYFRNKIQTNFN